MDKITEKIFKSKLFVILTPLCNFVLFLTAGFLMRNEPYVIGYNFVSTYYRADMKKVLGIWLIGLAVSLLVFLVCILIRKAYLPSTDENEAPSDK